MMHPTLVAALAVERHADLLRAADAHRRATALSRRPRRQLMSRAAADLRRALTALRPRITATQPQALRCCA